MTISLITTIQRWEGLSTDDKPTTDVKGGSTFYELDTGKKFVWNRVSWKEDLTEPASSFKFSEKQDNLRRLVESIAVGNNLKLYDDNGHYNFIENR